MFRVPTRPLLKSFWLAASLTAALLIAVMLWAFSEPTAGLWGVLVGSASSAAGLAWPGIAKRPYESWTRLTRKARRAARLWLTGVVFLIVTVVGWLGGRLTWRRPESGESGWSVKSPLPPDSYRGDSDLPRAGDARVGWTLRFGEWAWRSGNVWAWSLIPMLALLKGVEGESRSSLGGNVYTLY